MAIINSILSTSQTDLLTVPASKSYAITTILVCNYGSVGSTSFNLHLVKSGDSAGNSNIVVSDLELPIGETFTFDSEKIVLEEGDSVVFFAGTDLSATISYLEV
jgi:hypothetical protein